MTSTSALTLPVPPGVVRAVRLGGGAAIAPAPASWSLQELRGRLVEISGVGDSACLTLAFSVVLDAQHQRETVAWVTRTESCFFPLDAWASGADLQALAVIRLPGDREIMRATDRLARSGGFGLVVFDLGSASNKATALGRAAAPRISPAMLARLRSLAHRHDMAMLCLTRKTNHDSSLGPMVSLRAEACRDRLDVDRFTCTVNVLKDKQRGAGWRHAEILRGPDGLQ